MYNQVFISQCLVDDYYSRTEFENITFIDDNKKYIRKGREFGWNGIWFTPYIDSAEAIRQTEGTKEIVLPVKFRQADNIQELEQALNDFGINV